MDSDFLRQKSKWLWQQTLLIHKISQGTRIASCLSCVDILTVLFYGKILSYQIGSPDWAHRDRLIVSKAHGSLSLYPIFAEIGYFDKAYLTRVGKSGSILGDIPDCSIPGYETVNGSLGHGLGVACGMALAMKCKGLSEKVFVLSGDGELYEGAVWEAIMFAGHHKLDNLILIIDNNQKCMLDYTSNVINLSPLAEKFNAFRWDVYEVEGHEIGKLYETLRNIKNLSAYRPIALIANTVKGKGIVSLEGDPLCHIRSINPDTIDILAKT